MTAYYNEIDPKAAAWLRELIKRNLIAPGEVDERSIIDVKPDDLRGFTQCHFFAGIGVWSYALRRAGWPDDRPVWSGSCPCQPFSAAGKGDEFADERHLWPAWFRLARELRPDAIFGEQVSSKDALAWFDHVRVDLEGEGYAVGVLDTCAAGVGAPHIRQRLYFVAQSDGRGSQGHELQQPNLSAGRGEIGRLADSSRPRHEGDGRQAVRRERDSGGEEPSADGCGADGPLAHPTDPRRPGAREHDGGQPQLSARPVEHGDLGDTQGRGLGIERHETQQGSGGHADGAEQLGVAQGDAKLKGLERHRRNGDNGNEPGRIGAIKTGSTAEAGTAGRMADATSRDAGEERQQRGGLDGLRTQGGRDHGKARGHQRPGPTNGFWADAEWIFCRDGKARPTEPGTFPLVTGAPARVVRLRGYGNAINAEQARIFIESYIEVRAGL